MTNRNLYLKPSKAITGPNLGGSNLLQGVGLSFNGRDAFDGLQLAQKLLLLTAGIHDET